MYALKGCLPLPDLSAETTHSQIHTHSHTVTDTLALEIYSYGKAVVHWDVRGRHGAIIALGKYYSLRSTWMMWALWEHCKTLNCETELLLIPQSSPVLFAFTKENNCFWEKARISMKRLFKNIFSLSTFNNIKYFLHEQHPLL